MTRTPVATRSTLNPIFSDGYESNHSGEMVDIILGEEENFRSPIDLTSRTPTHIRFGDAETELNQLAIMPLANSQVAEQEAQLREALIVVKYLEEQVPNLQKPNEVIADIPQPNGSIARQSGERSIASNDSSGATVPEESTRQACPI